MAVTLNEFGKIPPNSRCGSTHTQLVGMPKGLLLGTPCWESCSGNSSPLGSTQAGLALANVPLASARQTYTTGTVIFPMAVNLARKGVRQVTGLLK